VQYISPASTASTGLNEGGCDKESFTCGVGSLVGVQGCESSPGLSPIMPSTPRSRSGREHLWGDSGEFLNDTGNNETFSIIDTASSNPNSVLASMPTVGTDEGGDDVIVSVKESVDSGRRLQLSSLPTVPRKKARTDQRRQDSQVKAKTSAYKTSNQKFSVVS